MSSPEHDTEHPHLAAGEPDEGEVLQWTCHPLKRRPLVAVLVTLLIGAIGTMVYYATEHSSAFTGLALAIMLASLAKFYFPTGYRLSEKRVTIKTTTQTLHKEWKLFRSCYRDKNGLLLSPFVEPTRLENFRGLYLMFESNGDAVTSFAQRCIKQQQATGPQDEAVK